MSLFRLWRSKWVGVAILLAVPLALGVALWQQMSWRPRILNLVPSGVTSMTFSPDGQILAAASMVNEQLEVSLWNTQQLTLIKTMTAIGTIDFAPDNKTFVGAQFIETRPDSPTGVSIKMFDTATRTLLWTVSLPGVTFLPDLAYWPDQQTLTGTGVFGLKQWDAHTGKLLRTLSLPGPNDRFSLSPDKASLLVTGPDKKHSGGHTSRIRLEFRDARTDQHPRILQGISMSSNFIMSPDGQTLAIIGYMSEGLSLWSTKTGKLLHNLPIHGPVGSVTFISGSKTLVGIEFGHVSSSVVCWDTHTGQSTRTLPTQNSKPGSLSVSADGSTLAGVDSETGHILLWDTTTGQVLRTITGAANILIPSDNQYRPPALTADGSWLAVYHPDGNIVLQRIK